MTPPLLSVKLRNQLRKLNPSLEVELKNTNIILTVGKWGAPATSLTRTREESSSWTPKAFCNLLWVALCGAQSQSKAEATRQAVVETTTRQKIGSRATS